MQSWTLEHHRFDDMTKTEAKHLTELAIGRLMRLGARPTQAGDDRQFAQCKYIIERANEVLNA